jgi:gliding motility-associated-like protein
MRGYGVEIYNRYMQKVFEGSDGWNGTYRGAPADPGTYYYRLFKKSGKVEKGTLEVVKF